MMPPAHNTDSGQSTKLHINVVWFKRDLRLSDHAPLMHAFAANRPTLMIYNFEPLLLADTHYTARHWRFVWQSLEDLNQQLSRYSGFVYHFSMPMTSLLQQLHQQYDITLYSHEEIGLFNTYKRDQEIRAWCQARDITWHEYPSGAVQRGLAHRQDWETHWYAIMRSAPATPNWRHYIPVTLAHYNRPALPKALLHHDPNFQHGGPKRAHQTLNSFLADRGQYYHANISKPGRSQHHCSRLSPYLAWGNISLRQVYQATNTRLANGLGNNALVTRQWRKALNAFKSRLHWHCHFIQKFESQNSMEHFPLNRAYGTFPYRTDDKVAEDVTAWQAGQTGFPLIDACMRCLNHTGYINFRMRAMLVSFVTHHLNIHWRAVCEPLSRYFLDFEPGIHYPQIHMQASITGINTIRIYNPVKQSQEQDPEGHFIRQWCPEIAHLDNARIHEPWAESPANLDGAYPTPMIDLTSAAKAARERLWAFKKTPAAKAAATEVIAKHVTPDSQGRSSQRRSSRNARRGRS